MKSSRLILIFFLSIFLSIVIIQNTQPVQAKITFITVEMPLILLLIITAVGGFALGILVALYRNIKNKSQN